MKTFTKILIGSGVAFVGYSAYKATQIKKAIEQLTASIGSVSKIKMNWNTLTLSGNLSINLFNPTNINLGINTAGAIVVTKIAFFNKSSNTLIGEANANISNIEILANSNTQINDIKLSLPLLTGVLPNTSLFTDNSNLLQIQITFNAFGKDYVINS